MTINGFELLDINTAPAGSVGALERVRKVWGFVPNLNCVLAVNRLEPVVIMAPRAAAHGTKRRRLSMAGDVLSRAHRIYAYSEAMIASFARADIPYAVQALLLLQITELLVGRALTHLIPGPAN